MRRWTGLLFLLLSPTLSPADAVQRLSLKDVSEKVSQQNFAVLANAHLVYQAKEAISVARANLLPRLNLWKVASIPFGWSDAGGLIEDIAPFLVPANWFRIEEQKLLHRVQQEGYRALWANELMTARILYLDVLLDRSLLTHVQAQQMVLQESLVIVQTREILGGTKQGMAREIEIQLLSLQEDERALKTLVAQEISQLSYLMGMKAALAIELESVVLPELSDLSPLVAEDFEFRALDTAPEIRQFGYLIEVSDWIEKDVTYSFLGSSNFSRGVAGGVFDNLPLQQGLGFGTAPSMQIVRSQKKLYELQSRGVTETILRQLRLLVGNYNLDLQNYAGLKRRVELTQKSNDLLKERLRMGEPVDADALITASRNQIEADTAFFGVRYRFLINQERLARLIFHADYNKAPELMR